MPIKQKQNESQPAPTCNKCQNRIEDSIMTIHRIDKHGNLYCDDTCYWKFMETAVDGESTDEEDESYYYDYTDIRDHYPVFAMDIAEWQKLPRDEPQELRAAISKAEDIAEEFDDLFRQYRWELASDGDDGPFNAEMVRILKLIHSRYTDFLCQRLDLVFDYWQANWKQELDTRATGKAAFVKSTEVIDEMEKMYWFYMDDLPEEVELEKRFFPIMKQMLDWRPARKPVKFGFGLRRPCAFNDLYSNPYFEILDLVNQDAELKAALEGAILVDNFEVFYREPEDPSLDFSWAFDSEKKRDEAYAAFLPFFNRPDVLELLELEGPYAEDKVIDRDDFSLVTFDAYPCECCDECISYTRSIDREQYERETDGWFTCYIALQDKATTAYYTEDSDFFWKDYAYPDCLIYMRVRRCYRERCLRVPEWAYQED